MENITNGLGLEQFDLNDINKEITTKTDDNLIDISEAIAINTGDNNNNNPPLKDSSSPFIPFANVLIEGGIFDEESVKDIDFSTEEGLVQAISKRINLEVDNFKQQYIQEKDPEVRQFMELIGKGISHDDASRIVLDESTVNKYSDTNLKDNEDLQKEVITKYLKMFDENITNEEIEEQLEYLSDTSKLESKSIVLANKLKEKITSEKQTLIEKQTQLEEQAKVNMQKQLEDVKTLVLNKKEIIPGKVLNDEIKNKIFESMVTAVGKDPVSGQPINKIAQKRLENPVEFEITLHYLNELGVFDGNWNGITNTIKSNAVKELEKSLSNSSPINGTNPSYNQQNNKGAEDILNSFKALRSSLNK